jgi:hypothetical protein
MTTELWPYNRLAPPMTKAKVLPTAWKREGQAEGQGYSMFFLIIWIRDLNWSYHPTMERRVSLLTLHNHNFQDLFIHIVPVPCHLSYSILYIRSCRPNARWVRDRASGTSRSSWGHPYDGEPGYVSNGSLTGVLQGGADLASMAQEDFTVSAVTPSSPLPMTDPTLPIWGSGIAFSFNFE